MFHTHKYYNALFHPFNIFVYLYFNILLFDDLIFIGLNKARLLRISYVVFLRINITCSIQRDRLSKKNRTSRKIYKGGRSQVNPQTEAMSHAEQMRVNWVKPMRKFGFDCLFGRRVSSCRETVLELKSPVEVHAHIYITWEECPMFFSRIFVTVYNVKYFEV